MNEAVVATRRQPTENALEIGRLLVAAVNQRGRTIDPELFQEALAPVTRYASRAVQRSLDGIGLPERHDEVLQDILTRLIQTIQRSSDEVVRDPGLLANKFTAVVMATLHGHWRHTTKGQPKLHLGLDAFDVDGTPDEDKSGSRHPYPMSLRHDPREMIHLYLDFRRRWPQLSWPDRRLLHAWVASDHCLADVGRQMGLSKEGASRLVHRALQRIQGEIPCSQWDPGRCLGQVVRHRGRMIVVMPVGAQEWLRDGSTVTVNRQAGEARVVVEGIRVSQLVGLAGKPMGEWLPAITSIRGVRLENLLEAGGEVRIYGPPFDIRAHVVPS